MRGRLFGHQPARNRGLGRRNQRVYVHRVQKNRSVSRARCNVAPIRTERQADHLCMANSKMLWKSAIRHA